MSTDEVFDHAEALAIIATYHPEHIPQYQDAPKEAQELEGPYKMAKQRTGMTQVELILHHTREAGSISQREAMFEYSITSFFRRLTDLEAMGHHFRRVIKRHPVTGQQYTRVYLAD